jgi:hypothetical protein
MSAMTFAARARKHWTRWLPKKVAQLKADGELESALQVVGQQAHERMLELMAQGFRAHEAEEVVMHELVLLPPEAEAKLDPWERAELARLEREYRAGRA